MNIFRTPAAKLFFALCALSFAVNASAETKLVMQSASGDYIGQGLSYNYVDDVSATIGIGLAFPDVDSTSTSFGAIKVVVSGDDGKDWELDFDASGTGQLAVGSYTGATRFPFNDSAAGLSISGDGRACDNDFGTFQIFNIGYDEDGSIDSFAATFTQQCESLSAPVLTGSIEVNVPAGTIPLPALPKGAARLAGLSVESNGKIKGVIQNAAPKGCVVSILSGASPSSITTKIFKKSFNAAAVALKSISFETSAKPKGAPGQKTYLEVTKQCAGFALATSKAYSLKLPKKKR